MKQQKKKVDPIQRFHRELDESLKRLVKDLKRAAENSNRATKAPKSKLPLMPPLDWQHELQNRYVECCLRTVPGMMDSLCREVLPFCTHDMYDLGPEFTSALDKWAERHGFRVPWGCHSYLTCVLFKMKNGTPAESAIRVNGSVYFSSKYEETSFHFSYDGWTLVTDGMGHERKMFADSLARSVCEYVERQVSNTTKQDYGSARDFRKKTTCLEDRLEWLVKRCVLGKKAREIVDEFTADHPDFPPIDESRVRTATNELADIIRLRRPFDRIYQNIDF